VELPPEEDELEYEEEPRDLSDEEFDSLTLQQRKIIAA